MTQCCGRRRARSKSMTKGVIATMHTKSGTAMTMDSVRNTLPRRRALLSACSERGGVAACRGSSANAPPSVENVAADELWHTVRSARLAASDGARKRGWLVLQRAGLQGIERGAQQGRKCTCCITRKVTALWGTRLSARQARGAAELRREAQLSGQLVLHRLEQSSEALGRLRSCKTYRRTQFNRASLSRASAPGRRSACGLLVARFEF